MPRHRRKPTTAERRKEVRQSRGDLATAGALVLMLTIAGEMKEITAGLFAPLAVPIRIERTLLRADDVQQAPARPEKPIPPRKRNERGK